MISAERGGGRRASAWRPPRCSGRAPRAPDVTGRRKATARSSTEPAGHSPRMRDESAPYPATLRAALMIPTREPHLPRARDQRQVPRPPRARGGARWGRSTRRITTRCRSASPSRCSTGSTPATRASPSASCVRLSRCRELPGPLRRARARRGLDPGGRAVHGDGAARRQDPLVAPPRRRVRGARGGRRLDGPDLLGDGRGARPRHRPPGHQASNVLVTALDRSVRIIDFGASRIVEGRDLTAQSNSSALRTTSLRSSSSARAPTDAPTSTRSGSSRSGP